MKSPTSEIRGAPKVRSKNLPLTGPLRDALDERIQKLGEFDGGIVACRVTLEGPGGHHREGRTRARVAITVPEGELGVNRRTSDDSFLAIGPPSTRPTACWRTTCDAIAGT